jgi:hypothetical protein
MEEGPGGNVLSNNYTNHMRMAIRTLKNPTPLAVDIVKQQEFIELRVDAGKFQKLNMKSKMSFLSYLNAIVNIIESGGSRAAISGIDIKGA